MYQYIIDDNTTNKAKDTTSKTKSILDKFSDVDKKYTVGNKIDSKLSLQKIDYKAPSQDEVLTKAQNSLNDYKNNSIDSINNKYNLQNSQIDKSINDLKTNQKEQKSTIENIYSNAKENASNDAIKRGLARSSIIVNKLNDFDNKMINDLEVLSNETSNKINSLNTQKNTLELEKSNALKSFDIEYALKLQDKINSINEDIAKNEESATKYNNQIAELEAKWNKEIEKENYDREMDMADFIAKNSILTVNNIKRNEKYGIAKEYFNQLDKQTAIAELESNSAYKENLGDTLYAQLLRELKEK